MSGRAQRERRVPVKRSAGLLVYRFPPSDPEPQWTGGAGPGDRVQVLIGHMGGPLWEHRDHGAWSIPKGEYLPGEGALEAARREFTEELGLPPPTGDLVDLGEAVQKSGKVVRIWAVLGELDPQRVTPGTFTMIWPPGSGQWREFPELDRVAWFPLQEAHVRLLPAQRPFLDRLAEHLMAAT